MFGNVRCAAPSVNAYAPPGTPSPLAPWHEAHADAYTAAPEPSGVSAGSAVVVSARAYMSPQIGSTASGTSAHGGTRRRPVTRREVPGLPSVEDTVHLDGDRRDGAGRPVDGPDFQSSEIELDAVPDRGGQAEPLTLSAR